MRITKQDDCIWLKHLPEEGMRTRLSALQGGAPVSIVVNGQSTVWERMRDGKDGRATLGLKLVGQGTAWRCVEIGSEVELHFDLGGAPPPPVLPSPPPQPPSSNLAELYPLIADAKKVAIRYRELTGRPLGITGEVAEVEAARLMGAQLCPPREAGWDAIACDGKKVQIKGRVLHPGSKSSQRLGTIKLDREWDLLWFVQLDEKFSPTVIWEACREDVVDALAAPGSKARERGALGVGKMRAISREIWPNTGAR